MPARTLIDTKVFVYPFDATDPRKYAIANRIDRDGLRTHDACISTQVAQECLNVVCSKARVPLTPEQAQAYLNTVLAPPM